MAAEVVARELRFDLYRVDRAGVISKWIGETEKNLDRIFTAAELANAILLFDEADALFGKRSEVQDLHDRYANIEVSYLLQKMEAYDGVAVLATNRADDLDEAFLRRTVLCGQVPVSRARGAAADLGRRMAGRGTAGRRRRLGLAGARATAQRRRDQERGARSGVPRSSGRRSGDHGPHPVRGPVRVRQGWQDGDLAARRGVRGDGGQGSERRTAGSSRRRAWPGRA